jgi:addiction module HigA family antidote
MSTISRLPHPGRFIKAEVIPAGMPVTKAAALLGVGRPALSNLLNGNAALSADMALRLHKVFGVDRELLLKRQADYDQQESRAREKELAVRTYAPSFMDITARQIEAWADQHGTRAVLAVLLRKLIYTTTTAGSLSQCDFPAHDNSQRPGWDGRVDTDAATPWIPMGHSGWEFGCDSDFRRKANDDYTARTDRTEGLKPADRKKMTYVFVTPWNWPGKDAWAKEKAGQKIWKDVRALDADSLEQWLEESTPAQSWLAERLGIRSDDLLSLEAIWDQWAEVTQPKLARSLFNGLVNTHKTRLEEWLNSAPTRPFVVTANSNEESLAFLSCALGAIGESADKAIVLRSAAALQRVHKASSKFIAVIASPEAEKASAGLHKAQHTIIVRKRHAMERDADIAVDLVDDDTFRKGLVEMGVDEEEVQTLSRASGQSLTLLRRHLAVLPEVKVPPWAADNVLARKMIPLGFAGSWDSQSKEDREILKRLTGESAEAFDRSMTELLSVDHAPVWSAGRHQGVSSALDILYATHHRVTRADLENYFQTARVVLSERDPVLDLPEDQQDMASFFGKARSHSDALRQGIRETLVLLGVHGKGLFDQRLNYDVEHEVNTLVRELLMPFSAETWASQKSDLPLYAEAAPDAFLDVVAQDLKSPDPQIMALLKPAGTGFLGGGCPRSGLLWALELLAWAPERLLTVASLLGQMSQTKIDDNWSNKPEHSLHSTFLAWMPQTAATVELRCLVLERLTRLYPEVAWRLCVDQFDPGSTVGDHNNRPRWRKDASGAGQPVTRGEAHTFARKALDLAIGWSMHNASTLGDLVQRMHGLDNDDQEAIWERIRQWIATGPGDEQKARLRERIRVYAFTRRARRRGQQIAARDTAKDMYDQLTPGDPVLRHQWLFTRNWVEESWDELDGGMPDIEKREARIAQARMDALGEVLQLAGYPGIFKLAQLGEAGHLIGHYIAQIDSDAIDSIEFIVQLVAQEGLDAQRPLDRCLSGYLFRIDETIRQATLNTLMNHFLAEGTKDAAVLLRILKQAPCATPTWNLVDQLPDDLPERYWTEVSPNWISDDEQELRELVERLLLAQRPTAAFAAVRFRLERIDSPTLLRVMQILPSQRAAVDASTRFDRSEISEVFELLDARADIPEDELARLEFLFLSALEHEPRGIPHLERQLSESPAWFAQAVGLTYRRSDDGIDPPDWLVSDEPARTNIAAQAQRMLKGAKRIPGTDEDGRISPDRLSHWIREVRSLCATHGRGDVGDSCIGELLSKSPHDEDGIWPIVAIRNVLEELGNERISRAMAIGLYNQRGFHWRDVGGKQERELAIKYDTWSRRTAVEWPYTSRLLRDISKTYSRDAQWHDTEADLRQRVHR